MDAGGLVCGVPWILTSINRLCPALEENSESWCIQDKCGVGSYCRCETKSHIPLSHENNAKADPTSNRNRHKINEAMAAALVRTCNDCNKAVHQGGRLQQDDLHELWQQVMFVRWTIGELRMATCARAVDESAVLFVIGIT